MCEYTTWRSTNFEHEYYDKAAVMSMMARCLLYRVGFRLTSVQYVAISSQRKTPSLAMRGTSRWGDKNRKNIEHSKIN